MPQQEIDVPTPELFKLAAIQAAPVLFNREAARALGPNDGLLNE
jgi:hypothetical protein